MFIIVQDSDHHIPRVAYAKSHTMAVKIYNEYKLEAEDYHCKCKTTMSEVYASSEKLKMSKEEAIAKEKFYKEYLAVKYEPQSLLPANHPYNKGE